MYKYLPQSAPHPSETLCEAIDEQNLSVPTISTLSGLSEDIIKKIMAAEIDIDVDISRGLERATGIPSHWWLNNQNSYNRLNK